MKTNMARMPLIASAVCVLMGSSATAENASEYLEGLVPEMPRGSLGIPAQWFEMQSLVGWEKMMLVFGYADNSATCEALAVMAKEDSPDRNFRCISAN